MGSVQLWCLAKFQLQREIMVPKRHINQRLFYNILHPQQQFNTVIWQQITLLNIKVVVGGRGKSNIQRCTQFPKFHPTNCDEPLL